MEKVKVLAIDGSLRNTGALIIEVEPNGNYSIIDAKLIKTSKSKDKKLYFSIDYGDRARSIAEGLDKLIKHYGIQYICSEAPSGSQSSSGAYSAGISIATQETIAYANDLIINWVKERDAKKALCGKISASKLDMQKKAATVLPNHIINVYSSKKSSSGFSGEFEHIADALGVFLASLKSLVKLMNMLNRN